MADNTRTLELRIIGDAKGAVAALDSVERKAGGTAPAITTVSTSLAKLAGVAGGFAVAGALTQLPGLISEVTGAASNMAESVSKANVVYGREANGVVAWAGDAAKALGMSQQAAIESLGTFGNLFVAMKIGQPEAANMSKGIVQLAADLASFNNIDPAEALTKLRAGLVGEAEPLRTLGVNLNAADISARAMALGFKQVNGQFDAGAKAQAAYSLILEQTKTAQGDYARTSDGLANSQRTLAAQVSDLKVKIGEGLIEPMKGATAAASDLVSGIGALIRIASTPIKVQVGFEVSGPGQSKGIGDLSPMDWLGSVWGTLVGGGQADASKINRDLKQANELIRRQKIAENTQWEGEGFGVSSGDFGPPTPSPWELPGDARWAEWTKGSAERVKALEAEAAAMTNGTGAATAATGAVGGLAAKLTAAQIAAENLKDLQHRIEDENTAKLAEAWMAGGQERVNIVRAEQAAIAIETTRIAGEFQRTLGTDVVRSIELAMSAEDKLADARKAATSAIVSQTTALWASAGGDKSAGAAANLANLVFWANNPGLMPKGGTGGGTITYTAMDSGGGVAPMQGRALGGPVRAGESYIVGEHRAEVLHMGSRDGFISPSVGGGGPTIQITIEGSVILERDLEDVVTRALVGARSRGVAV